MDNLSQDTLPMHIDNYSEPVLPDYPIRYVEEHNVRIAIIMLMMASLWVLSGWLTIYGLFFSVSCQILCIRLVLKESRKLYVKENLNVKKVVKTVLGEYF